MPEINWDEVFTEVIDRAPGATEAELQAFVGSVGQPLSAAERESLRPFDPDPETWRIPDSPLPASYLNFLRWSNGGEFRNGDRLLQFQPILDPNHGVRALMLAYGVPCHSPGILPFAMNGGGIFYAFDMRFHAKNGEYGIVAAECSHPHTPFPLEFTFLDACRSTVDFELAWDEKDEITRPMCHDCGEYLVCPECGKRGQLRH